MTTFDLTPLYRSAIGFDRLADLLSTASRSDGGTNYPPYNIAVLDEDSYRITMAVAGFTEDQLSIESERNTLTVSGRQTDVSKAEETQYLYRGIATRSFERRFQLADHVEVSHAELINGMLHIDLKRELPEQMKPRQIPIRSSLESNTQATNQAA